LSNDEIGAITAFLNTVTGEQPRVEIPMLPVSTAKTPQPEPLVRNSLDKLAAAAERRFRGLYACANGEHTVDVLRRLRTERPDNKLIVVWDGAPLSSSMYGARGGRIAKHRRRAVARMQS
jgi:hypothetical protein